MTQRRLRTSASTVRASVLSTALLVPVRREQQEVLQMISSHAICLILAPSQNRLGDSPINFRAARTCRKLSSPLPPRPRRNRDLCFFLASIRATSVQPCPARLPLLQHYMASTTFRSSSPPQPHRLHIIPADSNLEKAWPLAMHSPAVRLCLQAEDASCAESLCESTQGYPMSKGLF